MDVTDQYLDPGAGMIRLLPRHPPRRDGEILSTWMLRVASAHVNSVRELCKWLGRGYDNPLVGSIAEAVGVAKKVVIESLPSSFYGLYRKSTSHVPLEWTSFGRIWGGTSSPKFGNQYCPACLREFGHYQLRWTFAIYTCCLRHRCFLRDSCPHCGKVFRGADRLFNSYIVNAAK
jgi:TniQ